MKKLLMVVGLSMIGVLLFASAASAACAIRSASSSGSASASACNDLFTVSGSPSVSASPFSVPQGSVPQGLADGGGPSILLPAAALLLGSGILTYVILRRR